MQKREWDRVANVLTERSVACEFISEADPRYGEHCKDRDNPGKCFCESWLYNDNWKGKEKEFIISESRVHVTRELPAVGKKVEMIVQLPKWPDGKWWVCTVGQVEASRLFLSFDGLGQSLKPAWVNTEDINRTGKRQTTQRPFQAPWGNVR